MTNRPIFIDFEASSLSRHSHPIEVVWSGPDGAIQIFLIKPEPSWTDWDDYAENAIHSISRAQLHAKCLTAADVVEKKTAALSGQTVYASDPMFDGMWCEKLFDYKGYSVSLPFEFGDFKILLESHFGVSGMPSESVIIAT